MTTPIPYSAQRTTASEILLESKRHAAQCQADLKQAKSTLKLAEKTLKRAKKDSRKASKREQQAQKRHDDLQRGIKKSKTRDVAKPATPCKDESVHADPPAAAADSAGRS